MHIDPHPLAHGGVGLHLDAAAANRVLLALEHLDQSSGLDPAFADLRAALRAGLIGKSSGDIDSAPSTE